MDINDSRCCRCGRFAAEDEAIEEAFSSDDVADAVKALAAEAEAKRRGRLIGQIRAKRRTSVCHFGA